MQKITPFLWFDDQAEEAMKFYTEVFPDSKVGAVTRYDAAGADISKKPEGSVMTANIQLNGQDFVLLNGGPIYKFTEAISFVVTCEDQKEIDYYWEKLSAVPESEQCGWLKDKFGVSWQIVPKDLDKLLNNQAATEAMLGMKKLVIADLQKASQS